VHFQKLHQYDAKITFCARYFPVVSVGNQDGAFLSFVDYKIDRPCDRLHPGFDGTRPANANAISLTEVEAESAIEQNFETIGG
jgi:hypothetical protein